MIQYNPFINCYEWYGILHLLLALHWMKINQDVFVEIKDQSGMIWICDEPY